MVWKIGATWNEVWNRNVMENGGRNGLEMGVGSLSENGERIC